MPENVGRTHENELVPPCPECPGRLEPAAHDATLRGFGALYQCTFCGRTYPHPLAEGPLRRSGDAPPLLAQLRRARKSANRARARDGRALPTPRIEQLLAASHGVLDGRPDFHPAVNHVALTFSQRLRAHRLNE